MTDQELRARLDEMTLEHEVNDRLREKQIAELKRFDEMTIEHEVNDRLREKQIAELKRFDEMTIEHEVNDRLRGKQIDELKRLADDTRKELSRMPWVVVSLIAALVVIVGAVGGVLSFFFGK